MFSQLEMALICPASPFQIALESMRVVYRRIDGKIDGSERSSIVREFREKKHIKFALVSISAGGKWRRWLARDTETALRYDQVYIGQVSGWTLALRMS